MQLLVHHDDVVDDSSNRRRSFSLSMRFGKITVRDYLLSKGLLLSIDRWFVLISSEEMKAEIH
jgi:geranylgeranyl pyrophosphate synthase